MWNMQCFCAHDFWHDCRKEALSLMHLLHMAWWEFPSDGRHICAITGVNVIPGVIRQHEYICMDSARRWTASSYHEYTNSPAGTNHMRMTNGICKVGLAKYLAQISHYAVGIYVTYCRVPKQWHGWFLLYVDTNMIYMFLACTLKVRRKSLCHKYVHDLCNKKKGIVLLSYWIALRNTEHNFA